MRRVSFALLTGLVGALSPFWPLMSAGAQTGHPASVARQLVMLSPQKANPIVVTAAASDVTVARLRAMWQRVAICEVGGDWDMVGPYYSGIGFSNATWNAYGGNRFARLAGQASMDQQILVGMKITNGYVPDQYGCSPTGW